MANDLYDGPCEAGCQHFHGGEVRHHPDCGHYPESLTKLNADTIEALQAENAALKEYAFEVSKALTGLTVGGSEFFKGNSRFGFFEADIPACLKNVQWRMEQQWKLAEARTRAALQQDKEGE